MRSLQVERFSLADTLECGQTFCWVREGEGYINADIGKVVYVEQRGDELLYETSEGENRALGSVAFRMPLIPLRYYHLDDVPQLQNLKFGMSMGIFADTGVIWFQKDRIDRSMFQSGFGFGLHFQLPYLQVLRLEMAFDEKWNRQFIVDIFVDI